MVTRTRSRDLTEVPPGDIVIGGTTVIKSGAALRRESCLDEVGTPTKENIFSLTRRRPANIAVQNGVKGIIRLTNVTPSCQVNMSGSHLVTTGKFRSDADAIRSSHPGEPSVDIPNFLYELKDLPSMLKHAAGRAQKLWEAASTYGRHKNGASYKQVLKYIGDPKNPAEDYLNYNFGWRPFFSDIGALAPLMEKMAKRRAWMASLLTKKRRYITRRATLGSFTTNAVTPHYPYSSYGTDVWSTMYQTTSEIQWIVSHWSYNPLVFSSALSRDWLLLAMETGLDASLTHFWDLMPWTWLVDWFTDASSVIHAYNNRWGIGFINASKMMHKYSTFSAVPEPNPFGSDLAQWVRESKERAPTTPTLTLPDGINYFNSGQLTTLASLLVTRLAR